MATEIVTVLYAALRGILDRLNEVDPHNGEDVRDILIDIVRVLKDAEYAKCQRFQRPPLVGGAREE